MGFLFYKKRQKDFFYIYIKINKYMKLKKEYLEYSIFVKGKRLYFVDMNEKQMRYWSENGFKKFFEITKPVKIDKIEEDKKEINEEDDTNK